MIPAQLEGADIRLLAEPSDPELLLLLLFFLHQLFLDLRPQLGERGRVAAAFLFRLQNVKIRSQLDDVADAARRKIERHLLQFRSQGLALDPRSEERRVGKECRSRWS